MFYIQLTPDEMKADHKIIVFEQYEYYFVQGRLPHARQGPMPVTPFILGDYLTLSDWIGNIVWIKANKYFTQNDMLK